MHKGRDWFEAPADLWNKHGSESQREHEIERASERRGGSGGSWSEAGSPFESSMHVHLRVARCLRGGSVQCFPKF